MVPRSGREGAPRGARVGRPVAVRAALTLVLAALTGPFIGTHPAAAQEGYFDGPIPSATCEEDDPRKEVLLLGSYHMANPGADRFNLEADDVLAPGRQAEIEAVVASLAGFAPTHVAVEAPWGDTSTVTRYEAYLSGDGELGRSEEEQIGFRLARRLAHETIHPIDVRMGLEFEAVMRVAADEPRLARKLGQMEAVGEQAMAMMGGWLSEGTVGHMLHRMNEPENLEKAHRIYVDFFVPVAVGDDYAGADMVASWYKRNLRIFANLTRIATEPEDRVFVLFGQGHIPILRQLVVDHPDFCVEDPLPYLAGL